MATSKYKVRRHGGKATMVGAVDPMRSALMARVKGKNSAPEMRVRRIVHALGFRFRLHSRTLPGTPDLVFAGLRKVILVHGCFWHRHSGCNRTTNPKTRAAFWAKKFKQNRARDARVARTLRALGWDVLVVWECQTFDHANLSHRVRAFLAAES